MLLNLEPMIHPGAKIGANVVIGPYSFIAENVEIGDDCVIEPHVVIGGRTVIGKGNRIRHGSVIGCEPDSPALPKSDSALVIGDGNSFMQHIKIVGGQDGQATQLGNNNLIMAYSHIGPNCIIENRTVIANSVNLAENVTLEEGARIGGLCTLSEYCRIGKLSMIGGVSKIKRDVPPFMLVDGVPAAVYGLNKIGLQRSGVTEEALAVLKKAYRLLYRSDFSLKAAIHQLENEFGQFEEIRYLIDFLRKTRRGVLKRN